MKARTAVFGLLALLAMALLAASLAPQEALAQTADPAISEPGREAGNVPGGSLGATNDAEMWREVRRGLRGTVSIPDENAGVMIQSEGDNWRAWRNGPLTVVGIWAILIMTAVLALFFLIRGRIRLESGPSGRTIERFNGLERAVHWMTAVAFILLALTGLNLLYGRNVLLPVLGPDVFSTITLAGKYVHNFIALPFMLGILLMFVLWVVHNIPNRADMVWISKGGGMFRKGVHAPARKFNAGQKIIFWLVVLGGLSLSLSGVALLFPFEFPMFEATFRFLNIFGLGLPSELAPIQEMQLAQLWHGAVGLFMIAVIIAHIYIGSLGMEGAFAAMGSGRVDENWAREHHDLWVAELRGEPAGGHQRPHPAE